VAAAEHGRANGHEVRDGMVSIADELGGFSMAAEARPVASGIPLGGCSQSAPSNGQSDAAMPAHTASLTVASAWFSFTPRARRRCASNPNCEITSLSSCLKQVSTDGRSSVTDKQCQATTHLLGTQLHPVSLQISEHVFAVDST
jgi:hypothetical protein